MNKDENVHWLTDPHFTVDAPVHYTTGDLECIDAIRALPNIDIKHYFRANILKYLWRYPLKGGVEDLLKAQKYLSWLIEEEGK